MSTLDVQLSKPSYIADEYGRFGGEFGGRFVPETLVPALDELEQAYNDARIDPEFQRELNYLGEHYVGRPTALYFAEKMTAELGGARIYLKREDLAHTGAHKINNARSIFFFGWVGHFQLEMLGRIKRSQIIKTDAVTRFFRIFKIDLVDF